MGKTGLKLSEIALGSMYFGSYVKEEQAIKILDEAVNQGITFIDSADRYGINDSDLPQNERQRAESVIGKFLKHHDRDDLVLSTKLHKNFKGKPNSGGLTRKHIRESIKESLQLMRTDYVDVYYCHRPDRDTSIGCRESLPTGCRSHALCL